MIASTPRPLLALVVAAIGVAAAGCTRPGGVRPGAIPPEGLPDQESWGAVLRVSEGGRPRVVLAAPYLARYEGDTSLVRLGPAPGADTGAVAVTLYDDRAAPRARVRARRLAYFDAERRFVAEGDVAVQATGGRALRAERLEWDEEAGRLRAPGSFHFTSPTERIGGVGLVANEDLSRYAFRRARGTLEVRE